MRYLRELVLAHSSQKLILEEYIQRIDALEKQIQTDCRSDGKNCLKPGSAGPWWRL